jgi:hypothetical protein
MGRVILAVVLGAAIQYGWGALSWMVLGWHEPTMGQLKNEDALRIALGSSTESDKDLAYYFPAPTPNPTPEQTAAWEKKHKDGPVGVILYNPGGIEPMGQQTMLNGAVLSLVSTILAVAVLIMTLSPGQTYLKRVFIVVAMGIFAAVTRDLNFWNWMHYPFMYSIINAADAIVGWTAAGLVIAALIKPTPKAV